MEDSCQEYHLEAPWAVEENTFTLRGLLQLRLHLAHVMSHPMTISPAREWLPWRWLHVLFILLPLTFNRRACSRNLPTHLVRKSFYSSSFLCNLDKPLRTCFSLCSDVTNGNSMALNVSPNISRREYIWKYASNIKKKTTCLQGGGLGISCNISWIA